MSEDSNTTELNDNSSGAVFSWVPETTGSSSFRQNSFTGIVKQEIEENANASSSDSSSIICLDEFHKDDEGTSPSKKIKLEKVEKTENDDSTSSLVLPSEEQACSMSLDDGPSIEFDSASTSNIFSNSAQDCVHAAPLIDSAKRSCSNSKFTSIKRLSRDELEMIILNQMVDAITADKRIAALEEKLETTEAMLKQSIEKTKKLSQEVTASDLVLRRFLTQVHSGQAKIYHPPKKIVRNVGLQIKQETIKRLTRLAESKAAISSAANLVCSKGIETAAASSTCKADLSSAKAVPKASIITENRQDSSTTFKFSDLLRDQPFQNIEKREEIFLPKQATNPADDEEKASRHVLPPLPEAASGSIVPSDHLWKPIPPKLALRISKVAFKLNFCWYASPSAHADIKSYHIWGYTKSSCPAGKWELLAEFLPGPLPMTAQIDGSKWAEKLKTSEMGFFVIRATDVHGRDGPWSEPASIAFP